MRRAAFRSKLEGTHTSVEGAAKALGVVTDDVLKALHQECLLKSRALTYAALEGGEYGKWRHVVRAVSSTMSMPRPVPCACASGSLVLTLCSRIAWGMLQAQSTAPHTATLACLRLG